MRRSTFALALFAAGCGSENAFFGHQATDPPTVPAPEPPVQDPPPVVVTTPTPPELDPDAVEDCESGGFAAMIGDVGYELVNQAVRASVAGDEVLVCPGRHAEPDLQVRHDLSIVAADPTEGATVLALGVMITAPADVVVAGLTFDLSTGYGRMGITAAGLFLDGAATLTVESSVFDLGRSGELGSFGLDPYMDTVVRDSRFTGGALAIRAYGRDGHPFAMELTDTVLEQAHGAIQIDGPGELVLDGVSFDQNGGCGAIVVTVGALPQNGTEPVDIVADGTSFTSTRPEPSFAFEIPAAVSFRDADSFTCTGCSWTDNLPHDVVRDDTVFDAPGADLQL